LVASERRRLLRLLCSIRALEFEKGKNAVAVPSFDKFPLVIDILITAVRNGELDDQLAQAKKPLRVMTSRTAA
jgi:hypothetical protein